MMQDKVEVLSEIIRQKVEMDSHRPINVYDIVTKYTLDTICETAMGIVMDIQRKPENEYAKALHK